MDTLRCYWDVFFNAYGSLLTKTVLVLLLVWWCHQTLQRFRKEAPDATGPLPRPMPENATSGATCGGL
ncbi:hypothetical protein ACLQUA_003298 [Enterobacter ludwigii]